MRVIAGDYKGRRLEAPADEKVRPTSDKVKEAMFSILMNDIYGAVVCDLFAGTGGLGIEALSRGASRCYFADQSKASIRLVQHNVEHCGASERSVIIMGDYSRALGRIREKVDIFLLDPPYETGLERKAMGMIRREELLAEDGIIMVEHSMRDEMEEEICGFVRFKEKRYGKVVLSFYM